MRTVVLISLLTACSTEPPPPAWGSFGPASAEQRAAAIEVAIGHLADHAIGMAEDVALDAAESGNSCPEAISLASGATLYQADGCEAPSGNAYDGEVETSGAWVAPGPGTLSFRGLSRWDAGGAPLQITGDHEIASAAAPADYRTTTRLAITEGATLREVDMTVDWSTDAIGTMANVELGSSGYVEGIGNFDITGSFDLAGARGVLYLSGSDTLRVDFDATDASSCAPLTIDGVGAGSYCYEPEGTEGPGEPSGITAFGWGCVGGSEPLWMFVAETFGAVSSVRVRLATPGGNPAEELHGFFPVTGFDGFWELALPGATTYASGEGTQLSCPATPDLVFQALDATDEVLACEIVGDSSGVDVSDCP